MKNARISDVDYTKGMVKVAMEDKDNTVSAWIPVYGHEYGMPDVGTLVKVAFEEKSGTNAYQDGLCFREFFGKENEPVFPGKDKYYKHMLGDITILYDRQKKKLIIQSDKTIELNAVEQLQITAKEIMLKGERVSTSGTSISIEAGEIKLNGPTTITGETQIVGNLNVTGSISAANL